MAGPDFNRMVAVAVCVCLDMPGLEILTLLRVQLCK
jgi:hypothetical protein